MTWSSNPNEPGSPPVIFTSRAATAHPLLCDLWCVLHRMFQRREVDRAATVDGVHVFADASNGTLDLRWLDDQASAVGDWIYTVRLQDLFRASLDHPEGAAHFEQVVDMAVFCLVEDYEDLCEGEERDGWREGLRPIHWGRREIEPSYDHPAYALTMPKTSLAMYLSSDACPELTRVYV